MARDDLRPGRDLRPGSVGAMVVIPADLGPGVIAGFTTRAGGVSPAPWDSLDLGLAVGDAPERVRENRERVAQWVRAPVVWASQVHGSDVLLVPGPEQAGDDPPAEVDALVSISPDVAVGVLVADCVPVLLGDGEAGVVAAVHAGRRGLVDGVVQHAVEQMLARGADRGRLRAVIGPAVCGECYEVPAEMQAAACALVPAARATTSWGTPSLDLPRGVAAVLAECGVTRVHRTDLCTMTDPRFFSHRRAQADPDGPRTTGRFAGVARTTGVSPLA